MSIEGDIRNQIKTNDYVLGIIEVDELIAAWCYRLSNRFTRSVNFTRVPQQWRYSTPPDNCDDMMPCHVSYRLKASQAYSHVEPAYDLRRCHQNAHGWDSRQVPLLTELDAVGFARRNVAPYISPILDAYTLSLVCKDLGLKGKAVAKVINGRQYIVFSGYAGLRTYLPGTVYSLKNRKIIQMAIGTLGIKNLVRSGARLTICLTVPLAILECFLNDHATMASLIGNVSIDLAKIGIGAIMSAIAGLTIGAVISTAVLPIVATITVSVLAGLALEAIDSRYGLTDKLVAILEQYQQDFAKKKEALEQSVGHKFVEVERDFVWRAYGVDIKNGFQRVPGWQGY